MRAPLFAALLLVPALAMAGIYRHVDAQGRVTYTDQAPEDATAVTLEPVNTVPGARRPAGGTVEPPAATPAPTPAFGGYEGVQFTGIDNGQVLRNPEQPLTFSVRPLPGLQPGHALVVRHNGTVLDSDAGGRVTVGQLARGSHTFTADVVDQAGKVLVSSHPVTLQVHRHSALRPGRAR